MSQKQHIELRGVRVHNLQGIDLDLPVGKVIAVTGVSGSGKSSLAFDTLYAEGQRRYVESFSTYARRFLERFEKPDADRIEPIPPAVALRQRSGGGSRRATVGTVTETYDYLRILYGRWGMIECPRCGRPVVRQTPANVERALSALEPGRRFIICFPPIAVSDEAAGPRTYEAAVAQLAEAGFSRVIVGGRFLDLAQAAPRLPAENNLLVVVDRLTAGAAAERIGDSLELAFRHGGACVVLAEAVSSRRRPEVVALQPEQMTVDDRDYDVLKFHERPICDSCGTEFPEPDPALFNFNSPLGACPKCRGTGEVEADPRQPAEAGTLTARPRKSAAMRTCPECGGTRLRSEALAVRVAGQTIVELTGLTAVELLAFVVERTGELGATDPVERPGRLGAGRDVVGLLHSIEVRLQSLCSLGLGYLTLDRPARTLSSGESRRVRLTAALGSEFVNLLYVLDEPSAGLHPRDSERLAEMIERLRNAGNTVVLVEHDRGLIGRADEVIDLGPGAGKEGGRIVFQGAPAELAACDSSITGDFISGRRTVGASWSGRRPPTGWLRLGGVEHRNLHALSVDFPLGVLCVITGVSGSGKSSLVQETLYPAVAIALRERTTITGGPAPTGALPREVGSFQSLAGLEQLDDVLLVDHTPIGRSGRMNPASYLNLFGEIRSLFAGTAEAKARNFSAVHFSFNSSHGGRCETCRGAGTIAVDMQFLPDVVMTCPDCRGTRFRREILEVKYRGLSIAEVLAMTVREAFGFFRGRTRLQRRLKVLKDVGLVYVTLGQPAATLSGGEVQRLKLAAFLARSHRSRTLFVIDEPTCGLHPADISRLLDCLGQLLAGGHSLIVIEHNLDFIRAADYLIDLGPESGPAGGCVVATGTPEEVMTNAASVTGRFLAQHV